MNALKLFTKIIFPHLWLTKHIFGVDDAIIAAGIGAAGSIAGSLLGGGRR